MLYCRGLQRTSHAGRPDCAAGMPHALSQLGVPMQAIKWIAIAGLAALALAAVAYPLAILPWHTRWGATDAELRQALPGDELVPQPKTNATRAITIEAPPAEVWAWLVQIGQGRGGFYSYDRLENLVGCDIHSADRIVPELQRLEVGDKVRMMPEGQPMPPPWNVVAVDPGRSLVLENGGAGELAHSTWAFVVQEAGPGATRLTVRSRGDWQPGLMNTIMWRMVEPVSFFMEQGMLRGIRQRAEAA